MESKGPNYSNHNSSPGPVAELSCRLVLNLTQFPNPQSRLLFWASCQAERTITNWFPTGGGGGGGGGRGRRRVGSKFYLCRSEKFETSLANPIHGSFKSNQSQVDFIISYGIIGELRLFFFPFPVINQLVWFPQQGAESLLTRY